MRRRSRSAAVVVLALSLAANASATLLVGADLTHLAHDARLIARGRVVATAGRWTADHRTIETLVTLEVEEYLKGSFGTTMDFTVPGGRLGRYRNIVVGAPTFELGDRVVVFLGSRGPSVPYLIGLGQGVYRVVPAPDRSGWVVTPPEGGGGDGVPVRVVRGDPSRRALPVAEFDARVRALSRGGP